MRFLLSEKRYETPIAAGLLQYEQDGQPTGTIETWRQTRVGDDYTILRVDLDARKADGDSYLYHLVQDAVGKPQRLIYRFLGKQGAIVAGNVLFGDVITNSRTVNGVHFAEEAATQPFFFPSSIGLRLLLGQEEPCAVLVDMYAEGRLLEIRPNFQPQRTRRWYILNIGDRAIRTTTMTIQWGDETRILWRDSRGWPLKMQRGDGLTAIETRYIVYAGGG